MEKKRDYRYGFALGKFMPPHEGHLRMIRVALEQVDELTVLVCTVEREPIPGDLRFKWMNEIFAGEKRVRLVHVKDEVPSYPDEHPDFDTIWTALLKKYIRPGTEVFFSSETYGNDVAQWLTISHVLVDHARHAVPVSATAIREAPFSWWDYIPAPVRPYFVKRVVLTGPESTGKTMLSEQLAAHFGTVWVPEYGREHFEQVKGKLALEDISLIARGQLKREEAAAENANRFLFCDTDLVVTQVWSEIYFAECPQWIVDFNRVPRYDLHLLLDIDIPWVDDGTREFPGLREKHFSRLKEVLDRNGSRYEVISGNYKERFEQARKAVERLITLGNP